MNFREEKNKLKKIVPPDIYKHSLGVAVTAYSLASCYRINRREAYLAGLWHDNAKHLSASELREIARKARLGLDRFTMQTDAVLHAFVGAAVLQNKIGLNNSRVLQAVRMHTTGGPSMSLLEKIVYIADVIEPGRDYPGVDGLRRLAFTNFDEALKTALDNTLKKIIEKSSLMHPLSVAFWNEMVVRLRQKTP